MTALANVRSGTALLLGAAALAVPGVVLRFTGAQAPPPLAALAFGVAIVGAAFLLSWAAEAAQVDISAGLAIAVLALIAVLPEYAVDFVFAYDGGHAYAEHGRDCAPPGDTGTSACDLALANMTGANRILIGIGWAMVVFIAWTRWRARRTGETHVTLEPLKSVDITFLALATAYSLTLPLRSSLSLLDTAVLVTLFVGYMVRVATAPPQEPDLIGPALFVGSMPKVSRRAVVALLFAAAAAVILVVAEPFAESLVESGRRLRISEFFLVQWVAPLASETPELMVAGLYAWRLHTSEALGTLVSSKVNQWTLLVGTLPVVFALASGSLDGLPISPVQREELLLTAAQSAFAVALLLTLTLTVAEAGALITLFAAQFALEALLPAGPSEFALLALSAVYLVLAVALVLRRRQRVPVIVRDGLRTRLRDLAAAPAGVERPDRAAREAGEVPAAGGQ